MLSFRTATLVAVVCAFATSARAQPFAPTIIPEKSVIAVSQTPEKIVVGRPKVEEQTVVNFALGATLNGGNTRSFAGNVGGRLFRIHDNHQFTVEALGTLGGARGERLRDVEWTSQTALGRARYDLFVSQNDALFVALAPRHDRFAGIRLRLQSQAGYLRNLYRPTETHRIWTELGYDFTYDNFMTVEKAMTTPVTGLTPEQIRRIEEIVGQPLGDAPTVASTTTQRMLEPNAFVHSARIFLGYTNRLFASANLSAGAETLLDFKDAKNVRVNGLIEFTSSITHSFKLGLQSRLLFDNVPVPGKNKLDTIFAMQLVYTFDTAAGALNAPCPICDCTTQVQAAKAACRGEPLRQINP